MNKNWNSKEFKIGVLGGGQLGRMLIQEAINLNLHIHIMDPDQNAPCASIAQTFTCAAITDFDAVMEFGKDKNLITVEIENVNIEALEMLEKSGVQVYPQPHVLKIIKDKGTQKQFYKKNGIPTSPFVIFDSAQELMNASIELPAVQKLRTGGYDGKGVQILKDAKSSFDAPHLIENLIDFEKEISIIVARNDKGQISTFPSVECEFNPEAHLVEFLFSPAEISQKIENKAKEIAADLIEKIDMVGILAVEMFLTKSGDILVNEIAPRPHNSGHHTIECCETSQFAQHLRAILSLPLGSTALIQPGAMINLLGEKGHTGTAIYGGLSDLLDHDNVFPHLYGKEQTKPFRKMGHVTITGKTLKEVKETAEKIKDIIQITA
ncbi:5-(carboxyamino)imidazole ribonucleotide synthase [Crocinitomicaceae bacterium]|jgi:5-(carboxyamino)imidazole ribonucleotide synthase|nr:5-(carboxyamino)imidazole ribonucleotide synthase [Crocinitomicaceae bacterium]MDC3308895.1 5-(carboxyamino)imidazole ribonucleotide synthase [Crocinitomicaceae bacterium]